MLMKNRYPTVCTVYFFSVLAFSIAFTHPVTIAASFLFGFLNMLFACGTKKVVDAFKFIGTLMILTIFLTPIFIHKGITIIVYLPWGNPLTLESILYGIAMAFSMASVMEWIFVATAVMSSDKMVFSLSRVTPSISLVICVILRLLPNLVIKFKEVYAYQKSEYTDDGKKNRFAVLRRIAAVFSVVLTWALESGIQTVQSMKSRGYGAGRRTSFYRHEMTGRDKMFVLALIILACIVIIGAMRGAMKWNYFLPSVQNRLDMLKAAMMATLSVLYALPLISDFWEAKKWKALN